MKTTMDLEKEFRKILDQYGTDVLALKQDKRLRCSCFNEVTQEASRECPLCLGFGYSYVAEKHRVRSEDVMITQEMVNVLKTSQIGGYMTGDRRFFTAPELNASEKDLFILVDWDQAGRPIYNGGGVWAIKNVDQTQDLGQGQQIFKVFYASLTPVRSKIRGMRVQEMNGIKQYHILLEG